MLSHYSQDASVVIPLLSSQMRRQVWRSLGPLSAFLGFIKKPSTDGVEIPGNMMLPQPTGMPIEVYEDFIKQGQEEIIIPMKRIFTGAPTMGDSDPEEQLERRKIAYHRCQVNATGHGVNVRSGPMSQQRVKIYRNDLEKVQPELADYFSRYTAYYALQLAYLEGASHNLTSGREGYPGAKSLHRWSHPNMLVAGSGHVAFNGSTYTSVPRTDAYEDAVAAAINGMTAVGNSFTARFLRLMVTLAPFKRIAPLVLKNNGGMTTPFYPVILHSSQAWQLKNDPEYKADRNTALPRGWDNPAFTNAIGYYAGAVIWEQQDLFGPQLDPDTEQVERDSTGAVRWGLDITPATENIFQRQTTDIKAALLFGSTFLGFGIAEKLRFADQTTKFGRKYDVWADWINGCVRVDRVDEDNYDGAASGQFLEHTGSLLGLSYSPDMIV